MKYSAEGFRKFTEINDRTRYGSGVCDKAAACCMTIKNSIILPTINFTEADEECDIDCVPNASRRAEVRIAANNAYAFGGNNSCVLFSEVCDG